ncbi:MAG TPA: hypothetical protein VKU82_15675 [Planctomycetaceae bacterium]|nr:hypothetical protein [Planctomycetaceae bacterium]
MSRYPLFDRLAVRLSDLDERQHLVQLADCLSPGDSVPRYTHPDLAALATAILEARRSGRPVILMMGAHVIKQGLSRYLVDLIERSLVTHVATNGAGIIHDFELASIGATSEDVARYIKGGEFGMWLETGELNDIAWEAYARNEGLGESVGRTIEELNFPNRDVSVCAAGYRKGVPVTSHVNIGADIVHAHPDCDGASWGDASYTDFLIFAQSISQLEGGVFLNVGSAVTGPEVYLKALSMARNVARQRGETICHFTTAVFDLVELPANFRDGHPPKTHPQYYYRPWKTILIRTVADGGQSYYFQGDHRDTIPALHKALTAPARLSQPGGTAAAIGK